MDHPVSSRSIIVLLTDFGSGDGDVGVMKGVMLGIAPDAYLIDLTHDIKPQLVASGAWVLGVSYRYFPAGTIFLCVVDPGVGSKRRALALSAGSWLFVGPDNGLFSYVLAEQPARSVVELTNPAYHRTEVSATFHGRDIFSPVAAHLASGVALSALGPQIDPATLRPLPNVPPVRRLNTIEAHIIHVDHFGNLITDIPLHMVPELFHCSTVQLLFPTQGSVITERRRFFSANPAAGTTVGTEGRRSSLADVSRPAPVPFIYGDSSNYVAVAVQNGNVARILDAGYGASVTLIIEEA